jgi:hypothetical protein
LLEKCPDIIKIQISGEMSGLSKTPNYWSNVQIIKKSKLLKKCPDYQKSKLLEKLTMFSETVQSKYFSYLFFY